MEVLTKPIRPLFTTEEMPTSVMGMDESGIAFAAHYLRDRVYSNKVLAVVREYLSNAFDEHHKFHVDRPVEVVLPTIDNPTFSVRDYANGLDDNGIRNIFGFFFKSTKTKDRNLIGGLGIGGKSGHAYGDQFTVTSWNNGEKAVYVCALEGKGPQAVGKIIEISREATDEPSGILVCVPVAEHDVPRFASSFAHLAAYLPPTYNVAVNGVVQKQFDKSQYPLVGTTTEGKDWCCSRAEASGGSSTMTLVVGYVPYRMEFTRMRSAGVNVDYEQEMLLNGLVLFCGASDVSVALSRETIEFCAEKTIPFLDSQLSQIHGVILDETCKAVEACKTLGAAANFVITLPEKIRRKREVRVWDKSEDCVKSVADLTRIHEHQVTKVFVKGFGDTTTHRWGKWDKTLKINTEVVNGDFKAKDFIVVYADNERYTNQAKWLLDKQPIGTRAFVMSNAQHLAWRAALQATGLEELALKNNPKFFAFVVQARDYEPPKAFKARTPRAPQEKFFAYARNTAHVRRGYRADITEFTNNPSKCLMWLCSDRRQGLQMTHGVNCSSREAELHIKLAMSQGYNVFAVNTATWNAYKGKVVSLGEWYDKVYAPTFTADEQRAIESTASYRAVAALPPDRARFVNAAIEAVRNVADHMLAKVFDLREIGVLRNVAKARHYSQIGDFGNEKKNKAAMQEADQQEKAFVAELNSIVFNEEKHFRLSLVQSDLMKKFPKKVLDLLK